jgi:hypothetical protein
MNTRNKDTRTRNIHIKIDPELLKAAKMRLSKRKPTCQTA